MRARLVWITGASSGIGRATALEFAHRGWLVAASARNRDALESLAAEAPAGRIHAFPVDITDAQAMAATVAAIEGGQGPIGLAILNAGTHKPVSAQEFDIGVVRDLFEVNVFGTVHGLSAVMPRMIARGQGQIAVVSSVAGYAGLPTAAAYGATKAALINMAESLRFELQPLGVDIRLVSPGFVRTPLTDRNEFPMPFRIEADEAARIIFNGLTIGRRFEITFPRRFSYFLKLLRHLPYRVYFTAVARGTGKR